MARTVHWVVAMEEITLRRRDDGVIQILPPRNSQADPSLASLVVLVAATGLYISTLIHWVVMVAVAVGCLCRLLVPACRACLRLRNPRASVQSLPSGWRRAC